MITQHLELRTLAAHPRYFQCHKVFHVYPQKALCLPYVDAHSSWNFYFLCCQQSHSLLFHKLWSFPQKWWGGLLSNSTPILFRKGPMERVSIFLFSSPPFLVGIFILRNYILEFILFYPLAIVFPGTRPDYFSSLSPSSDTPAHQLFTDARTYQDPCYSCSCGPTKASEWSEILEK